jgi:pimeloyl-ACP methyl ester carboxylesterase
VDLRDHGRSGRSADGDLAWSHFADDLLAACDDLGLDRPAAFGHSCGGASLLLAEQARPGSFRSLYLFEPVVVPAWVLPPGVDEVPLAVGARRRREVFPSRADAFANFASKPPFGDLDPDALDRYVEDGFEEVPEHDGGDGTAVRLRCHRLDEAEVYTEGTRHTAFAHLGEVACPVTLAFGSQTDAFGREIMEADAAPLPDATVVELADLGHFGPLQQPGLVAASVVEALGTRRGTAGP